MMWFILGREKLLSTAEIAAVLNCHPELVSGSVLKLNQTISPEIIRRLGGTIKIGQEIGADLTREELKEKIIDELKKINGKIQFGLSFYGPGISPDKRLGLEVKKELQTSGKSARLVAGKNEVLNAAQIKYNKLIDKGAEFLISPPAKRGTKGEYDLARTMAVQDVDDFSARDFGRPGRDDRSGMLPPKLAMMLINLAQAEPADVILDPFCGSGTILTEALLMGYKNLIGSDISKKAITDTQKNIEWVRSHSHTNQLTGVKQSPIFNLKSSILNLKLLHLNATKLNAKLPSDSIDVIITEPYLGQPLRGYESETQLRAQAAELKKLYLAAFAQFAKILKPNGKAVFITPRFKLRDNWIAINMAEELKKLGFLPSPLLPGHEFLLYARPDQKVGREIWRFTLLSS